MTPKYLTPKELSDRYNGRISVGTLANWRSSGNTGPKFTRIGGRIMYPEHEVIAWEQRRTVSNTSEYRSDT